MTRSRSELFAGFVVAVTAAIVVVAIAILPFLTPAWVSFEQGRTHATALTGYSEAELGTATNSILHDLVVGPPDFAAEVAGRSVLEERERAHMRDVRVVFAEFYAVALAAAAVLVVLVVAAARRGHVARAWRAIAAGMRWLIVGVIVAGVVVTFFFDAAFEVFHELFFPSGSYTFDPRTDRLVQLFPFDFWSETTLVLGVLIVTIAASVWAVTRHLGRETATEGTTVSPPPLTRPEQVG